MDIPHGVIHSPVDGHLDCFQLGANISNICEHLYISFWVDLLSFLLGISLGVELLCHLKRLCLTF